MTLESLILAASVLTAPASSSPVTVPPMPSTATVVCAPSDSEAFRGTVRKARKVLAVPEKG